MNSLNFTKTAAFLTIFLFFLNSCGLKLPGGDAKRNPPDPKLRVQKNIEEGRGFRLSKAIKKGGGKFEFASSNELWRASLDTLDFIPLPTVNYSGGIIITDWYSTNNNNQSIKISIRFLTNEIRSDAITVKVFNKKCKEMTNCVTTESTGNLSSELKRKILKTATLYEKQKKDKNFKAYTMPDISKKN
jgi:hypothetical protein